MKHLFKLIILAVVITSCTSTTTNNVALITNKSTVKDTTPRVTGIGGIFFKTKNVKATKDWYGKHLGLTIDQYGCPFEVRNANNPNEINYLEWSAFNEKTDYFEPSKKEFMINYRVQNIEGLVRNLKKSGVTIVDTILTVDYGKFVHIMDADGNKIELWEPVDSVLTKIGSKTTK